MRFSKIRFHESRGKRNMRNMRIYEKQTLFKVMRYLHVEKNNAYVTRIVNALQFARYKSRSTLKSFTTLQCY